MDWSNVQPDVYMLISGGFTPGRPFGIKGVTLHHMAGELSLEQCKAALESAGTGAHYGIAGDGKIAQYVNDGDRAWACGDGIGTGGGNDRTISIEHANDCTEPWTVGDAAIESGAHLVAALCLYYGLGRPAWMVNVFPHKHWSATSCPGELAGTQRDRYMARACEWYDAMVAGTDAPSHSDCKHEQPVVTSGFGGTYRCTVDKLNVRTSPSLSGAVVASYSAGQTVVLDNWYHIENGYVWGRYTGYSGNVRYIAVGRATGKPETDDYLVKVG